MACCDYSKQAYEMKKFAFVSDVARGHALHEHGGIYLDADVEVRKSFDPLLQYYSFWGFEAGNYIATSTIGLEKGNDLLKTYLQCYAQRQFHAPDGSIDPTTNVSMVTGLLLKRGLIQDGSLQVLEGENVVCPQSWFSPYDYRIGKMEDTSNAYTIHHYAVTWSSRMTRSVGMAKRCASRIPGGSSLILLLQRVTGRG